MALSGVWTFSWWEGVLSWGASDRRVMGRGLCFPWPLWTDSHVEPGGKFCSCSFTRKILGSWPHSVVWLEWPGGDVLKRREGGNDVILGYGDWNRRELGWPLVSHLVSWVDGGAFHRQESMTLKFCASVTWEKNVLHACSVHVYVLVFIKGAKRYHYSLYTGGNKTHTGVHGSPGPPTCGTPLTVTLCHHPFSPKRFRAEKV